MATASHHSHMPDLSANLNENTSCAPLSDLWNFPQSKLFPNAGSLPPSNSPPSHPATSGVASPAPFSPSETFSSGGSLSRVPTDLKLAGSINSGTTTPTAGFGTSLWSRGGAPASSPATAIPSSSSSNLLGLAPGGSPTYRSQSSGIPNQHSQQGRGIWGPREDFGYRQNIPFSGPASAGRIVGGGAYMSAPAATQPQAAPAAASVPKPAAASNNVPSAWSLDNPRVNFGTKNNAQQSSSPASAHHSQGHCMRSQKKGGRPSTNTELYKTELCASYMSTGGNCPYGEKCQFAHGTQELKTVDRPPKWRSKPCQNWVKTGACSYNERCCFRHDIPVAPQ